uniref:cysteine-rich CWC family protein n=1 Tax=uncultured Dysgonomonas sp. TaxID=206096 RepID=UPI002623D43D|nr:cysteine-rich CWC family protein [uncultured Dysgonomonas sp.]
MEKICPRCSTSFRCREDRVELCNCSKTNKVIGLRDYVKDTYDGCLCPTCLEVANSTFYNIGINPKYLNKKKTV